MDSIKIEHKTKAKTKNLQNNWKNTKFCYNFAMQNCMMHVAFIENTIKMHKINKEGGLSFINLSWIITQLKWKNIYKDSRGRFELVNPWLNWIGSHWSHFWDGAYFPYSLHSILNIYKWRKNMEYKENQGALFTCLTQNWIPRKISHNHIIHQILFVWLALKCLTRYPKFTKSSANWEQ